MANWIEIESEYVTGTMSCRELAEKHGLSQTMVSRRCAEGKWKNLRDGHRKKITKKVQSEAQKKSARAKVKELDLAIDSATKLLRIINKSLEDENQFNRHLVKLRTSTLPGVFDEKLVVKQNSVTDTKRLQEMATALDKATRLSRDLKGIIDEPMKQKLDIEWKRLEMEQKKAGLGDDDEDETGVVVLPEVDFSLIEEDEGDEPSDNPQE